MSDALLQRLKQDLRALGLGERAGVFERRGLAVAKLALAGGAVQAAVVKKPSRNSPEWRHETLADSAAARDFVADLKKKLNTWGDRDD